MLFALVVLALFLAADVSAATRTWTGAAGNNWTVASNWAGGSAPVAGDDLVFPASGANQVTTNNDFPNGTLFHSIVFSGGGYALNGNGFTIGAGGIRVTDGLHSIYPTITLGAPQTWVLSSGSAAVGIPGTINLNGMALTIGGGQPGPVSPVITNVTGDGSINVTGPTHSLTFVGNNNTTAPLTATNITIAIGGTYPAPIILGDSGGLQIFGGKTVGTVTATGLNARFDPGSTTGIANSGNVTLISHSQFQEFITDAAVFNSLKLTGTISLGDADLTIATGTNAILQGTTFTIVDNDGLDPVSGTFHGLPEGAQVVAAATTPEIFSISYIGGTGNDIVLTAVGPAIGTSMTLTSSSNPVFSPASVTFTAKVSAASGTTAPTGTVDFLDLVAPDSLTHLATVALDSSGTATFTTAALSPGAHTISAVYSNNNPPFAPVTQSVNEVVSAGPTRHRAAR